MLDNSSTHTSGWFAPRSSTTSSTAGEMLPAATASLPAALHRCSTMLVTVVLPLAPVIARMRGRLSFGSDCANNSMSPTTATPRAIARSTAGSRNGTPGLIAISPGVPLRDPAVERAIARGVAVVGDIELFAQSLPKDNRPRILAITGANGKTTVTSMVEHLCKAAGKDAVAAGNISPAILDVVLERGANQPEVWVLELSSFQLETTFSLNADAATVLNISEDHLDRYADMAEYSDAKARIFAGCSIQVLNRDDARCMSLSLIYTSPSPRDRTRSRMPSSA